jgi:hypothetical protein
MLQREASEPELVLGPLAFPAFLWSLSMLLLLAQKFLGSASGKISTFHINYVVMNLFGPLAAGVSVGAFCNMHTQVNGPILMSWRIVEPWSLWRPFYMLPVAVLLLCVLGGPVYWYCMFQHQFKQRDRREASNDHGSLGEAHGEETPKRSSDGEGTPSLRLRTKFKQHVDEHLDQLEFFANIIRSKYKEGFEWWDAHRLAQKMAIAAWSAIFPRTYSPEMHLLGAMIILGTCMANAECKPYRQDDHNKLELRSLRILCVATALTFFAVIDLWSTSQSPGLKAAALLLAFCLLHGMLLSILGHMITPAVHMARIMVRSVVSGSDRDV